MNLSSVQQADAVPLGEVANLSLEEAAAYFGIGINKLWDMTNDERRIVRKAQG